MARTVNRRHLLGAAGIAGVTTASLGTASASAQPAPVDVTNATTPQDFGAVGDGVADDTDAVQQAVDAQLERLNKIVYLPPGTYRTTRTIVIPDVEGAGGGSFNRIVLAGAGTMGVRSSIIRPDFDGTALFLRAPLAAVRGRWVRQLCRRVGAGHRGRARGQGWCACRARQRRRGRGRRTPVLDERHQRRRLDAGGRQRPHPTADNVRDVGSAEHKVRTVHAHGLRLATVAADDLPEPSAGAVVLVEDSPNRTPMLAVSDGRAWRRLPLGNPIDNS